MNRHGVESSNIASIGYDLENEILEVEFKHGGVYQYYDVPEHIYEELMNASSHGQYLDKNIKKEGYEYRKL